MYLIYIIIFLGVAGLIGMVMSFNRLGEEPKERSIILHLCFFLIFFSSLSFFFGSNKSNEFIHIKASNGDLLRVDVDFSYRIDISDLKNVVHLGKRDKFLKDFYSKAEEQINDISKSTKKENILTKAFEENITNELHKVAEKHGMTISNVKIDLNLVKS